MPSISYASVESSKKFSWSPVLSQLSILKIKCRKNLLQKFICKNSHFSGQWPPFRNTFSEGLGFAKRATSSVSEKVKDLVNPIYLVNCDHPSLSICFELLAKLFALWQEQELVLLVNWRIPLQLSSRTWSELMSSHSKSPSLSHVGKMLTIGGEGSIWFCCSVLFWLWTKFFVLASSDIIFSVLLMKRFLRL